MTHEGKWLLPHLAPEKSAGVARKAALLLPVHSTGAFRLTDVDTGLRVEARFADAKSVPARYGNGYIVYAGALPGKGSIVQRVTAEGTEDFVAFETAPAASELDYELSLGKDVAGLRLVENVLEILDASGTPRLRFRPPFVVDQQGKRYPGKFAVDGCKVDTDPRVPWGRPTVKPGSATCHVTLGWSENVPYPALVDPGWTTTGSMSQARSDHAAARLGNGDVLVVGGWAGGCALDEAEVYHQGTWAAVANSMTHGRLLHRATALGDGRVLVTGGVASNYPFCVCNALTSAEIYDPAQDKWSDAGQMTVGRADHTSTLLQDGRVLVTGGFEYLVTPTGLSNPNVLTSAEIFDPKNASTPWAATGDMSTGRMLHSANLMHSGDVLVAGGFHPPYQDFSTAEIWSPATGTFTTTGGMTDARDTHVSATLSGGGVLVAGGLGWSGVDRVSLDTTEIYNPLLAKFTVAQTMNDRRAAATLTPLTDGSLLVAGGYDSGSFGTTQYLAGTELYQQLSQGTACTQNIDCATGYCADGVCCDGDCGGSNPNDCIACGKDGVCGPAREGQSCPTSTGSATCSQGICGTPMSWFPIGPAPLEQIVAKYPQYGVDVIDRTVGRVDAVAADPNAPMSDVWLGSAGGGVWRLRGSLGTRSAQRLVCTQTDSQGHCIQSSEQKVPIQEVYVTQGSHFEPVTDGEPSLAIGALKLDDCGTPPCKRVWAGTGESVIRRDTLYGAGLLRGTVSGNVVTWSGPLGKAQFNRGTIHDLVIDPKSPVDNRTLYVAVSSGLIANASQGSIEAPPPPAGFGIFSNDTNGDGAWTSLTPAAAAGAVPTDLEIDPNPTAGTQPPVLYAAFRKKGIFRYGKNGWARIDDPLMDAAAAVHIELAVTAVGPSKTVMYAALDDGTCPSNFGDLPHSQTIIFCTTRSVWRWDGKTWTRQYDGATASTSELTEGYPTYTRALAVDPTLPSHVLWGGVDLAVSQDSGASWSKTPSLLDFSSPFYSDQHQVLFPDPNNASLVYAVNDGGLYASADGGTYWNNVNDAAQFTQVQSIAASSKADLDVVVAAAQDQGPSLFVGPRKWPKVGTGDGGSALIDVDDENRAYRFDFYFLLEQCTDLGAGCPGLFDNPVPEASPYVLDKSDPLAFYPPLTQDPNPLAGQHPLYLGTNRLWRGIKADPPSTAVAWSAISPKLGNGGTVCNAPGGTPADGPLCPTINSPNVITAVALAPTPPSGARQRIYVGYYDGEVFYSDNLSVWNSIGGSGKGLPNQPVSAIAVDPDDPTTVYVAFSAFGSPQVYRSAISGSSWGWAQYTDGLPDTPAQALLIESAFSGQKTIWLGTDQGVFRRAVGTTMWEHVGGGSPNAGELPNVPVYSLALDKTRLRLYAGTHGRGVWVLGHPIVTPLAGCVNGTPGNLPIFGQGFPPNATSCTVRLLLADGTVCASGTTDAQGNNIGTDPLGNLTTVVGSLYNGARVAWGCYKTDCVGGYHVSDCSSDASNPLSTVTVDCGGSQGSARFPGCVSLDNPPSTALELTYPAGSTFVVRAILQAAQGGTRSLCSVPVSYQAGDTVDTILGSARDAINSSPQCAAAGVQALVRGGTVTSEEIPFAAPLQLALRGPGLTGTQLMTGLYTQPGAATNDCFRADHLGLGGLHTLLVSRLGFTTSPSGAAGGDVVVKEDSGSGLCSVTVPTYAGESAADVAAAVAGALASSSVHCLPEHNPRDARQDGSSVVFSAAQSLGVCIDDAGVGLSLAPSELQNHPPDCSAAAADPGTLWPPDGTLQDVTIEGVTDPDGDPVSIQIDQVAQDEASLRPGTDAVISADGLLQLRADRAGTGDGRVYQVGFTASDPFGATCTGTASVCVPHDQRRGGGCVYSGSNVSSGVPVAAGAAP